MLVAPKQTKQADLTGTLTKKNLIGGEPAVKSERGTTVPIWCCLKRNVHVFCIILCESGEQVKRKHGRFRH
jgi:hypothetical protein